jgi:predicted nucleotidyltransferase
MTPTMRPAEAEQVRAIARRHGVDRVRIFGSLARGEGRSTSDVDLLIRLRPGHGFTDFMAFCREVEAALGQRVDVVTEDGLSPFLLDRVLAEAIPL